MCFFEPVRVKFNPMVYSIRFSDSGSACREFWKSHVREPILRLTHYLASLLTIVVSSMLHFLFISLIP